MVVTSMVRALQSWFAPLCGTTEMLIMSMFCSSPAMGLSLGSDSMTSCLVCGSFGSSGGCARFLLGVLQPSAAEAIGACWSCAACGARDCVFWPFAVFGVVAVTFGPLLDTFGKDSLVFAGMAREGCRRKSPLRAVAGGKNVGNS